MCLLAYTSKINNKKNVEIVLQSFVTTQTNN